MDQFSWIFYILRTRNERQPRRATPAYNEERHRERRKIAKNRRRKCEICEIVSSSQVSEMNELVSRHLPLVKPSRVERAQIDESIWRRHVGAARCRAAIATRDDFRLRVAVSRCLSFFLSLSLTPSLRRIVTHMADTPFKPMYGTRSPRNRQSSSGFLTGPCVFKVQ